MTDDEMNEKERAACADFNNKAKAVINLGKQVEEMLTEMHFLLHADRKLPVGFIAGQLVLTDIVRKTTEILTCDRYTSRMVEIGELMKAFNSAKAEPDPHEVTTTDTLKKNN